MRSKVFVVLGAFVVLAAWCVPAAAGIYPTLENWPYRMEIALSAPAPLADYPVRVELAACTFPYTRANADGSDLRFTDAGGTVLSHWIETWDPPGISVVWVSVPETAAFVYLFFGNPAAADTSDKSAIYYFSEDWESGQNGWSAEGFGCSPNGWVLTWGNGLVSTACGELGWQTYGCPSEPEILGTNAEYIHAGADAWYLDMEGQANSTRTLYKDLTLADVNSRISFWATVNTCPAGNFRVEVRDPGTNGVLMTLLDLPAYSVASWALYEFDLSSLAQTDVRLKFTLTGANEKGGLVVVDDILIRKAASSEPVAALSTNPMAVSGGPYRIGDGDALNLDGSASADPNEDCGDAVTLYAWELGGDLDYQDASGPQPSLTWEEVQTLICGGACTLGFPYPMALMVSDTGALLGSEATTLTVYDNHPHATFTADPNPSGCLQEITFDASGSSHGFPDRHIVGYEWDFDYDGSFDVEDTGVTVNHSFPAFGEYTVALRVTDDNVPPLTDLYSLVVTIDQGNSPPSVGLPASYGIGEGDPLNLDAAASDPDLGCGDTLTYEWDLNGDGSFADAAGNPLFLGWFELEVLVCGGACLPATAYPVAVRVTDSFGFSTEASAAVTVEALAVAVKVVSPNRGEIIACGQPFDVTWVVQPEPDTVKVLYSPTGKRPWQVLAGAVQAADKGFTWSVPPGPATAVHKGRIKLKALAAGTLLGTDRSDLPFTVARMDLTTPDGGEEIAGGSTYDVTWSTVGLPEGALVDRVVISWSTDGGLTWRVLHRIDGSDPGTWAWEVPVLARAKRNCLLRVVLKDAGGRVLARDTSRNVFTVLPSAP